MGTEFMDLSLKPVPRQSPIPPNTVACFNEVYNYEGPSVVVISKNKQELVIEGPPLRKVPGIDDMYWRDEIVVFDKVVAEYLAVIEDLIPTIEFGVTHWAHLVPDPLTDGYQIILDYEKQLRQVSCPTWAPIIPIEEIEFTVWGPFSDRRGTWKGKDVDIFYAYDDLNMWRLNRVMYAYRNLEGLDFTYDLYGHLANRDGKIVGLVTEAAWGRPLGPPDKDFVTSALKRLESFGFIYGPSLENHFLIADGKLRLLQPIGIKSCSDPEEFKSEADRIHGRHINNLFQEFQDFGPYGNFRILPEFLIGHHKPVTLLHHWIPREISVENVDFLQYHQRSAFRAVIDYADDLLDTTCYDNNQPKRFTSPKRKGQRKASQMDYSKPRRVQMAPEDEDAPLASSSRLRHRVFIAIKHPYARSTSSKTLKTLQQHDSYPSYNNDHIHGAKPASHQRFMIASD